MYNKIISSVLTVAGLLLLLLWTTPKIPEQMCSPAQVVGIVALSLGVIWMFSSLMNTLNLGHAQVKRFNALTRTKRQLTISEEYRDNVIKDFKGILTKQFPEFESELITKFSLANEKDMEAFLAVCPQIESGNTYKKYVGMLSEANQAVKAEKERILYHLNIIADYNDDPWLWFKRSMPDHVQKAMNEFKDES